VTASSRPAFQHVAFDLDGTLVDSLADLSEAVNHVLLAFGRPTLPPETLSAYVGDGARRLIERALAPDDPNRVDAGLIMFMEYYGTHLLGHTRPYHGVDEMLGALAAHGVTCSVLTNKPVAMSRAILGGLGLLAAFVEVLGGDSMPSRKPDPHGLLHLARLAGTPPERVLLVGDSPVDAHTAQAAGTGFCGVAWGLAPDRLRAERPARIVDHPHEVVAVVLSG
jgi:phosphoglycolate phosphatase